MKQILKFKSTSLAVVYFSICCIGIDPEDEEFKSEFLPALAETIVDILAKIYTKFTKTSNVSHYTVLQYILRKHSRGTLHKIGPYLHLFRKKN